MLFVACGFVLEMAGQSSGQHKKLAHARVKTSNGDMVVAEKKHPELLEPHTFAPQDLLALLRNLENEICMCEISLKDENDKQNKYKVKNKKKLKYIFTKYNAKDFKFYY